MLKKILSILFYKHVYYLEIEMRSSWDPQSVKSLTLDFGTGHDLRVMRSSPI